MASSDTISIDTSALQNGLQQFDSRKAVFEKTAYSTYKGSYLKTSGSSTVAKLRAKVDGLYSDLSSSYSGISSYTKAYLESMLNLEASLKSGKLSKADEANVTERIMLLNDILNGGDPSEIEINPMTGVVKAGFFGIPGSYKALNMKEFEKANAAKKLTYIDENGEKVTIYGFTNQERNLVITASMSNSRGYYGMIMNSNKALSEKNSAILTYEYAKAPIAMGFAEGYNSFMGLFGFTTDQLCVTKISTKQQKTIDHSKSSGWYTAGYFGGAAAQGLGARFVVKSNVGDEGITALEKAETHIDRAWNLDFIPDIKIPKVLTRVNGSLGKAEKVATNKVSSLVKSDLVKNYGGTAYRFAKFETKAGVKRTIKSSGRNAYNTVKEEDEVGDYNINDYGANFAKKSERSFVFKNRVRKNVVRSAESVDRATSKKVETVANNISNVKKNFGNLGGSINNSVSDLVRDIEPK